MKRDVLKGKTNKIVFINSNKFPIIDKLKPLKKVKIIVKDKLFIVQNPMVNFTKDMKDKM